MSSAPRVSVLVPVYDAAATLRPALESIRRQTFSDFECVVVDDGSRDRSAEIVASFARDDRRFVLLRQEHTGIVGALRLGLAACSGRYVARMDADDLSHRSRLETQVRFLESRPELAAVGAHVWLFPRFSLSEGLLAYEHWLCSLSDAESVARDAFIESPIVHPTLCIRRPVLEAHGYREQGWPQDYDLVLRLLAAGEALAVVPARLLGWRDGPARLTRTADYTRQARIVACKAHFLASGFLAGSELYTLWGYGDTGRALAQALEVEGKRVQAIVELHPRRVGQQIRGAPVFFPKDLPSAFRNRVIACVAGAAPRAEARARAQALGLVEGRDFVVAA